DRAGRGLLAHLVGHRDPGHGWYPGAWLARGVAHGDRRRAPRPLAERAAAWVDAAPRVDTGCHRTRWSVPHRERAGGAGGVIIAAAPLILAAAAGFAFAFRKRLNVVGPFSLMSIVAAFTLVSAMPADLTGALLDLELRVTDLGRLASLVILATLFLLVIDAWLDEPAYNFFPTALAVGATALGVLVVTAPLLASEVPAAALAPYFGVLVPTTFIAFAEILSLSGLLPAIVQVVKVQDLLHGVGLVSAVGGAFLASGAPDLRRLVVYSEISN